MSSALSAVIVAIVSATGAFFAARAGNQRTQQELREVHVLVNSQLTRALVRNAELERLLGEHHIAAPAASGDPDDDEKKEGSG